LRFFFLALTTHSVTTLEAFEIPSEVSEHAQKVFIELRQTEVDQQGKVSTDDGVFHRWLTLAKYVSVASGNLQMT